MDSHKLATDVVFRTIVDPAKLPRKELPVTKLSELYRMYLAEMDQLNQLAAGRTLFTQVWKQWKVAFRRRLRTGHGECRRCHALKAKVRHSQSLHSHVSASAELLQHLQSQYRDRLVYYAVRQEARSQGGIVSMIVDSMDRGKFALPRWYRDPPKDLERYPRPLLECTAVYVHGVGCYFYLAPENMEIGGEWHCEVVSRALEWTYEKYEHVGNKPMPERLIVQADNTTSQMKNSYFHRCLKHAVADPCTLGNPEPLLYDISGVRIYKALTPKPWLGEVNLAKA